MPSNNPKFPFDTVFNISQSQPNSSTILTSDLHRVHSKLLACKFVSSKSLEAVLTEIDLVLSGPRGVADLIEIHRSDLRDALDRLLYALREGEAVAKTQKFRGDRGYARRESERAGRWVSKGVRVLREVVERGPIDRNSGLRR